MRLVPISRIQEQIRNAYLLSKFLHIQIVPCTSLHLILGMLLCFNGAETTPAIQLWEPRRKRNRLTQAACIERKLTLYRSHKEVSTSQIFKYQNIFSGLKNIHTCSSSAHHLQLKNSKLPVNLISTPSLTQKLPIQVQRIPIIRFVWINPCHSTSFAIRRSTRRFPKRIRYIRPHEISRAV